MGKLKPLLRSVLDQEQRLVSQAALNLAEGQIADLDLDAERVCYDMQNAGSHRQNCTTYFGVLKYLNCFFCCLASASRSA